mmetsp:Transcript_21891/g.21071  ORF Transcript_21891/g.21071 Transcript_21891/m.21071 type:complete len:80 (+) Transcript_21891:370-609(+)
MGLFLVDRKGATLWLNYILRRDGGQSRFGAVAENECSADDLSCNLSWETKITPVLSMMGGLADIVQKRLRKHNTLEDIA